MKESVKSAVGCQCMYSGAFQALVKERDTYKAALEDIDAGKGDPLPGSDEGSTYIGLIHRAERALADGGKISKTPLRPIPE